MLLFSCVFVASAGVAGLRAVRAGVRSPYTIWLMALAFLCQLWSLKERGEMRGQCPLGDAGEILLFISWSMTLFYLVTGAAFRLSLLGLFSTPVILLMQLIALIPGVMSKDVERIPSTNYWQEVHVTFSVMAYGALALSSVAAVMALMQGRKLKQGTSGSLVKTLPSVSNLHTSVARLALFGWIVLTIGILGGVMMQAEGAVLHLLVAAVTWALYGVLIAMKYWRGIPPQQMAIGSISLFLLSLLVFPFL